MTSARRLFANRRNAQRSTGPKSAAGKARAARNAVRHGLTRSPLHDPTLAPQLHALAERLCADGSGDYGAALLAVEAGAQLDAVTRLRRAAVEAAPAELTEAAAVLAAFPRLEVLARYETEARARRLRALMRL